MWRPLLPRTTHRGAQVTKSFGRVRRETPPPHPHLQHNALSITPGAGQANRPPVPLSCRQRSPTRSAARRVHQPRYKDARPSWARPISGPRPGTGPGSASSSCRTGCGTGIQNLTSLRPALPGPPPGSGLRGLGDAAPLVEGGVQRPRRLPDEAGPGQFGPAALHRPGPPLQGHHPGHGSTPIRDHHLLSRPNPGEELVETGLDPAHRRVGQSVP